MGTVTATLASLLVEPVAEEVRSEEPESEVDLRRELLASRE
jgi:hypothetical protein